jgi:hypothetical protein
MAAFYWNTGQSTNSGLVFMELTIVGEIKDLQVTSSPATMSAPVTVTGFQECIPSQIVECGPVPTQFLPLTARGLPCPGSIEPVQPSVSPSPLDPGGIGPWCHLLADAGPITLTQPGGTGMTGGGPAGMPTGGATPMDACAAAQNSSLLDLAHSRFDTACQWLRSDQANAAAYGVAAGAAAAVCAALIVAAVEAGFWVAQLILAVLAAIAGAVALAFTILAADAAANIGRDQRMLADAQAIWRDAIASVRSACCPDWIVINTDDLVCPS